MDERTKYFKKLLGTQHGNHKFKVYKCLDCEQELVVQPHLEDRVKMGYQRCNNPRCPGQKKGGGKYVRK